MPEQTPKYRYATESNIRTLIGLIAKEFSEYLDESEVEAAISKAIQDAATIEFKVVSSLPETGSSKFIYLLPNTSEEGNNIYDEYIWDESKSKFELLGGLPQEIDLSDYVKFEDLTDYVQNDDLSEYVKSSDLEAITDSEITDIWNDIMTPSVEE